MSYQPETDGHKDRDKVKVVLDFPGYATEKELDDAIRADTSNLVVKSDFITLKVEVGKLETNKQVNISTSLNNLKGKQMVWFLVSWKLFLKIGKI